MRGLAGESARSFVKLGGDLHHFFWRIVWCKGRRYTAELMDLTPFRHSFYNSKFAGRIPSASEERGMPFSDQSNPLWDVNSLKRALHAAGVALWSWSVVTDVGKGWTMYIIVYFAGYC
jgi:hypothetical protein